MKTDYEPLVLSQISNHLLKKNSRKTVQGFLKAWDRYGNQMKFADKTPFSLKSAVDTAILEVLLLLQIF